jgi:YidC/Oxa1 family membrane protein insertase
MEKRAIIAIALSVLVMLAFQHYFGRQHPAQREASIAPSETQTREKTSAQLPSESQVVPEPSQIMSNENEKETRAEAQTVVVEGDLYRAVVDNKGALLTSWELNHYRSSQGQIFEMITANHFEQDRPYLGSLIFADPALTALANKELYEVEVGGSAYTGGKLSPPASVTMRLRRGDLVIEKRFDFEEDNYLLAFSVTSEKAGKPIPGQYLLGQDIGPEHEHLVSGFFLFGGRSTPLSAVFYRDGKVQREGPPKDKEEEEKIEGNIRWAGLEMKYFSIIAVPTNPLEYFSIQKLPVKAFTLKGKEVNRDLLRLTIPLEESRQYQIYLGPKEQSTLEAVKAANLSGVINYGWFSVLVIPLLASLRWLHQYIPNYGLAIIILTFVLSLLLVPFRLKQVLSMRKMQAVQPKVKAIQEKYKKYKKTDPKRAQMNQEIMGIYKEHGVNPLGGCLPLVVQMPILFAFYRLLMNSIELRQAPFVGWIHDLSAPDPFLVLPIVMGITMFISQKMTPMTPGADPSQAKMMMLLPAFMTFFFLGLSSGLNLYFLCSNIFQVGFQKIAERWMGDGKSKKKSKR